MATTTEGSTTETDTTGADSEVELRRIPQQPAIDVVVYFMDKTGVQISLPNGKQANAGTLFETVMAVKKFDPEAREAFSLWLVSDLLELQLKPTHIPFKLVAYWEELLEKYTQATESDIERDEPVIMFQRNVFYPRSREAKIKDAEMLRLLFHEAKENVLDSRYPLSRGECDELAGIQALITYKTFDRDTHTPDFYKDKLHEFYPNRYCKKSKISIGTSKKDSPERRLTDSHFDAFKKYNRVHTQQSHIEAYESYLNECRKLPYYGAAFFKGQIEHPQRSKFSLGGHIDDPVYIAVNTDGVFIIDMDDMVFLLGLLYRDFSWDYAEPKNKEDRNCLPCLFIQFQSEENGENVTKLLQIFTREAVLVDAITEACVKLKKKRKADGVDGVDGFKDEKDGKDDGILQADGDNWRNFNRLSLTTFSKQDGRRSMKKKSNMT